MTDSSPVSVKPKPPEPFGFCHCCGTAYPGGASFPKTCSSCSHTHYRNPLPIFVPLIPVRDPETGAVGLLGAVRAIPPVDTICFPGGHGELLESGEMGAARECQEETGVPINPKDLKYLTSEPNDRGLVLFFYYADIEPIDFPELVPNRETKALTVIHKDTPMAFPLHSKARDMWMAMFGPEAFPDVTAQVLVKTRSPA